MHDNIYIIISASLYVVLYYIWRLGPASPETCRGEDYTRKSEHEVWDNMQESIGKER